jgi:hypothetical protein
MRRRDARCSSCRYEIETVETVEIEREREKQTRNDE